MRDLCTALLPGAARPAGGRLGMAPGTLLALNGDYTPTSTGALQVLVTLAGASSFTVTGTVSLAGTLLDRFAPGTYHAGMENFLIAASVARAVIGAAGLQVNF